jgi:putative MATE family efflux protein
MAALMTLVCAVFHRGLLHTIYGGVEPDVMRSAETYFFITALAYPFLALNNASAALFRATGNSRLPMLVSAVVNVVHIAGNALLILVFRLGVEGVALCTLGTRILGGVVMLVFQRRPEQAISLGGILKTRPDWCMIRMILRVGIPTGIENSLFQFGKLMMSGIVSTLGTTAIAVQAMTSTLEGFQSTPATAIGLGLVTVAGQCMGAGKPLEARRAIIKLTLLGTVVLAVSNIIVLVLTGPITSFAGMEQVSGGMTVSLMRLITGVKFFLWPLAVLPAYGMRAAGDVKYSMLVSTISMWSLRLGLCYILCRVVGLGVVGVWLAMFADWLSRSVFYLARFLRGTWMKKKVLI